MEISSKRIGNPHIKMMFDLSERTMGSALVVRNNASTLNPFVKKDISVLGAYGPFCYELRLTYGNQIFGNSVKIDATLTKSPASKIDFFIGHFEFKIPKNESSIAFLGLAKSRTFSSEYTLTDSARELFEVVAVEASEFISLVKEFNVHVDSKCYHKILQVKLLELLEDIKEAETDDLCAKLIQDMLWEVKVSEIDEYSKIGFSNDLLHPFASYGNNPKAIEKASKVICALA